jgi:hypothetical protein
MRRPDDWDLLLSTLTEEEIERALRNIARIKEYLKTKKEDAQDETAPDCTTTDDE